MISHIGLLSGFNQKRPGIIIMSDERWSSTDRNHLLIAAIRGLFEAVGSGSMRRVRYFHCDIPDIVRNLVIGHGAGTNCHSEVVCDWRDYSAIWAREPVIRVALFLEDLHLEVVDANIFSSGSRESHLVWIILTCLAHCKEMFLWYQ